MLLLLACSDTTTPPPEPGAVCPEPLAEPEGGLPRTVLLLSVDTVNRDFLGVHQDTWETTPTLDALFGEGVRFDNVLVPRGLSGPSMATMITGVYPVTHGVRTNDIPTSGSGVSDDVPLLYQRFADAGYETWGWLGNICTLMDGAPPIDHRYCQSYEEVGVGQLVADDAITAEATATIATLDPTVSFFGWVHLMDPHDPYDAREPWFSMFHPEVYTGDLEPTEAQLVAIAKGERAYSDEDRHFVEALYASQLRATDAHIGSIISALDSAGRLEDAVILVAFDHGDELARRTGYFFHGCSPYQGALATTWALRAPGRVPAGMVLDAWVPSVDMVPTLLEVAALPWDGTDGQSLGAEVAACVEPDRPAFFERGVETAGVVRGDWKYILDPRGGYTECIHYSEDEPFPGGTALYHLGLDPLEGEDRSGDNAEQADSLRREVCTWVAGTPWTTMGSNALVEACGG